MIFVSFFTVVHHFVSLYLLLVLISISHIMIDIDLMLACGANYKKVRKGETIFTEGTQASFYHQLVEGRVRWVNVDDNGKEFIQHLIEPGECFGEMPMFDNEPYAATSIADEDSLVLRLQKNTFLHILKDHPEINFEFSKLLSQRLRFKFMLVNELATCSPAHRIITLFNYLKQNKMNICPKCNKILLTRQQLANMTGLRVETVIRTIKYMEEQKLVTIQKGKVYFSK